MEWKKQLLKSKVFNTENNICLRARGMARSLLDTLSQSTYWAQGCKGRQRDSARAFSTALWMQRRSTSLLILDTLILELTWLANSFCILIILNTACFSCNCNWLIYYKCPEASIRSGRSSLKRLPSSFAATSAKSCCCLRNRIGPDVLSTVVQQFFLLRLLSSVCPNHGLPLAENQLARGKPYCNQAAPSHQDLQPWFGIALGSWSLRVLHASPWHPQSLPPDTNPPEE